MLAWVYRSLSVAKGKSHVSVILLTHRRHRNIASSSKLGSKASPCSPLSIPGCQSRSVTALGIFANVAADVATHGDPSIRSNGMLALAGDHRGTDHTGGSRSTRSKGVVPRRSRIVSSSSQISTTNSRALTAFKGFKISYKFVGSVGWPCRSVWHVITIVISAYCSCCREAKTLQAAGHFRRSSGNCQKSAGILGGISSRS